MRTWKPGDRPLGAIWSEDGETRRRCAICGNAFKTRYDRGPDTCPDCRDVARGAYWRPRKRRKT